MKMTTLAESEESLDGLERLSSWIGICNEVEEDLSPSTAQGLGATLDSRPPELSRGDLLPPLWHWIYFKTCIRPGEIGLDGHPRKGGFLPPVPLPRRMWAGSRLRWQPDNPLVLGAWAKRRSRIQSIAPKLGRSGRIVFVTVAHEIFNEQGLSVHEEQDIVYRAPVPLAGITVPSPDPVQSAQTESPVPARWSRRLVPDEVLLFRYSALTFNAHRIHYDRPYTTTEEGYPGLVVQGPLIATLLVDLLQRHCPERHLLGFSFKGVSPAIDGEGLHLKALPDDTGRQVRLWAESDAGKLLMQGTAELNS